jgi:hypothetical protein
MRREGTVTTPSMTNGRFSVAVGELPFLLVKNFTNEPKEGEANLKVRGERRLLLLLDQGRGVAQPVRLLAACLWGKLYTHTHTHKASRRRGKNVGVIIFFLISQ